MKTSRPLFTLAVLFFAGTILITSCRKKKEKEDDTDSDTTETSDQSFAESTANDIISIGSQATDNSTAYFSANKTTGTEETLAYCATIRHDSIHRVDTVIFNNSACVDGRVRNGILIFDYSASDASAKHYRDPGFKCNVKTVNYSVDGNAITVISEVIENTTPQNFNSSTTNLTWSNSGHITIQRANGTHDFTFTRNKTLLNTADNNVYHGAATPISWNLARIGITGNGSGTTVNGRSYTCNVTSQLVRDFGGCTVGRRHPFIQGTLEFTPGDKPTRTLDFGNGSCDLNATVGIRNRTFDIVLQ